VPNPVNIVDADALAAELEASKEREAATREILEIVSRSRDDEEPVFNAILESASKLCKSPIARLHLLDDGGKHHSLAAHWGEDMRSLKIGEKWPMNEHHLIPSTIRDSRTIHLRDLKATDLYQAGEPLYRRLVDEEGLRTRLTVPLLHGDRSLGCIALSRRQVMPFRDEEIELVETFAAQAVIAIENVRQFKEQQARLQREAATREILEVISQSRADEGPVFDAILSNAQRLCGAPFGVLTMMTEDGAQLEVITEGAEPFEPFRPGWRWPMDSQLLVVRSVREKAVLKLDDVAQDQLYTQGDQDRVTVVNAGMRSALTVPLVSGGRGVGSLALYRREVRPFTPDEIALVQTFAEQAVIAIENVRQFKLVEARTEEIQAINASLESRVKEQVGEIERMGRLKRFLPVAVANTVVSSGSEAMLRSHRALLGVLFCDIRGFTAFCETAEPEETIEVLQTYHEEMGKLIDGHGAGVDHRMGDGIMVLFNDPLPCDDPAGDAVRLAIAMRDRMTELCKRWKRLGHRLGFGVGISLGYATVGMVGYEDRYDYTASGTSVNLAARLCDLAEDGEILLSPRAYTAIEDDFSARSNGEVRLKGIREPVEVFKLMDISDQG
jgi:class 3 adenylate cyclase